MEMGEWQDTDTENKSTSSMYDNPIKKKNNTFDFTHFDIAQKTIIADYNMFQNNPSRVMTTKMTLFRKSENTP